MKKTTKALLMAVCAIALVVASVMGTLAYLTAQDTVENTFTVGKVQMTLDELDVDEYGVADNGDARVQANEYKLIPNKQYIKDPTLHIGAESEDCYVFVEITNTIAAIECDCAGSVHSGCKTIAQQLAANGWTLVDGETNVYFHNAVASANDNIVVFENFAIDGDSVGYSSDPGATTDGELVADADKNLKDYDVDEEVIVVAYAVQKEGFANANAAWAATYGAPVTP